MNTIETFDIYRYLISEDENDLDTWSLSPIRGLSKSLNKDEVNLYKIHKEIYKMQKKIPAASNEEWFNEIIKTYKKNTTAKNPEKDLRKRLSDLRIHYLEKYLGIKEYVQYIAPIEWEPLTLRVYSRAKMKNFYSSLKTRIEKVYKQEFKVTLDYQNLLIAYKSFSIHDKTANFKKSSDYFGIMNELADIIWWIPKFKVACETLNRNLLNLKHEEIIILPPSIPAHVTNQKLIEALHIVYKHLKSLKEVKNKKSIERAKESKNIIQDIKYIRKILLNVTVVSEKEDLLTIYQYLLNLFRFYTRIGNYSLDQEYLELIRLMMKKNLILQRVKTDARFFYTVIKISCFNKEVEFAEMFFNKFKNEIVGIEKNKFLSYCSLVIRYFKCSELDDFKKLYRSKVKDWSKKEEIEVKAERISDPQLYLDRSKLFIMLCIDGDQKDEIYYRTIVNLEKFLLRKKSTLPPIDWKQNKNFIQILKQIDNKESSQKKEQLKKLMKQKKPIHPYDMNWLKITFG